MRKSRAKTQNQFSILTVDDDAIMTSAVESYFNKAGYIVETENDPRVAIEKVRNGNFDILLLDFLMSPICGDKVVEEIRTFNKDIYIILLTGHKSMAPPIKTIRELDIQGYYEKGPRFDQLELLVESCTKSILQMRTIRGYQNELNAMYQNLKDSYVEMIQAMRQLVDARNEYTRGHSDRVSAIAVEIAQKLDRGATFLNAEGSFSRADMKVVLTAVKKQQLAELKELVMEIDPNAFVIVQEAHQVLGDGFSRYSRDAL